MVTDFDIIKNYNPWWHSSTWQNEDQHLQSITNKSYVFKRPQINELCNLNSSINIIRGPRQVGKTTLIKSAISKILEDKLLPPENVLYLSCETIENYQELHQTLYSWLNSHGQAFVCLDEISFVEGWARAILSFANAGLLKKKTLLITGSNAKDLKKSTERLPGRRNMGKDILLYPFSFDEFKSLKCFSTQSDNELFNLYLKLGGFPQCIKDYVLHGRVNDSTYEIYRNWIVGDAVKFKFSESILRQIAFRVFETLSSRVSFKSLIETTTVKSHETALDYIEHMEDAFISNILQCYDPDKKNENSAKMKKIYFIDPMLYFMVSAWKLGIVNIYSWIEQMISDPIFKGKLFEAVVVSWFKRKYKNVYFWYSSKTKQEIDVLLQSEKDFETFEVKLSDGSNVSAKILGKNTSIITPDNFIRMS